MMSEYAVVDTPRKTRADSVRNHELILCTARRLFDLQGVASVTMSAIADSAEIGKGTLYRHFPDKAELLFALVEHEAQLFRDTFSARLQAEGNPRQTLHWFIDEALAFSLRNNSLLCEATNHAANGTLNHPTRFWWRDALFDLFTKSGTRGDACYAADTVYMMLDAQTLFFQQTSLQYAPDHISRNLHMLVDSLLS